MAPGDPGLSVAAERKRAAALAIEARSLKDDLDAILKSSAHAGGGKRGGGKSSARARELRSKLRSKYEEILSTCDQQVAAAENVESNLWTLVFYSKIEEFRKKIRNAARAAAGTCGTGAETREDIAERHANLVDSFRSFLDDGVAFYRRLAAKIQQRHSKKKAGAGTGGGPEHGHDDDDDDDENDRMDVGDDDTERDAEKPVPECFKCYVCLGDLTRYFLQTKDSNLGAIDWTPAFEFYRQAAQLRPDTGNPYNQLAVLAVYKDDTFLGMYYYFRSLAVENPFITARANLVLLFENNRQAYQTISKQLQQQRQSSRGKGQGGRNKRGGGGQQRDEAGNGGGGSRGRSKKLRTADEEDGLSHDSTTSRKMSDSVLLRDFRLSFVRLHGILFAQTDMELYAKILEDFWANTGAVMESKGCFQIFSGQRTDGLDTGASLAFQCVADNIFAVHNVGYVPTEERKRSDVSGNEVVRNSVFYRNAFMLAFGFAMTITKRALGLGCVGKHGHSSRAPSPRRVFESPLVTPILMMLDWLSHQPRFVVKPDRNMRADPGEQALRDEYWRLTVELLNYAADVRYEEWMESSLLDHDQGLEGFQPLTKFYRTLSMLRGVSGSCTNGPDASAANGSKLVASVRAARCVSAGRIIAKSGKDGSGDSTSSCPIMYDDLKNRFYTADQWLTNMASPSATQQQQQQRWQGAKSVSNGNGVANADGRGVAQIAAGGVHETGGSPGVGLDFDAPLPKQTLYEDDGDDEIIVFKATSADKKDSFDIPLSSFGVAQNRRTLDGGDESLGQGRGERGNGRRGDESWGAGRARQHRDNVLPGQAGGGRLMGSMDNLVCDEGVDTALMMTDVPPKDSTNEDLELDQRMVQQQEMVQQLIAEAPPPRAICPENVSHGAEKGPYVGMSGVGTTTAARMEHGMPTAFPTSLLQNFSSAPRVSDYAGHHVAPPSGLAYGSMAAPGGHISAAQYAFPRAHGISNDAVDAFNGAAHRDYGSGHGLQPLQPQPTPAAYTGHHHGTVGSGALADGRVDDVGFLPYSPFKGSESGGFSISPIQQQQQQQQQHMYQPQQEYGGGAGGFHSGVSGNVMGYGQPPPRMQHQPMVQQHGYSSMNSGSFLMRPTTGGGGGGDHTSRIFDSGTVLPTQDEINRDLHISRASLSSYLPTNPFTP